MVFDHLRTAPGETASQNLISVWTTPLMVMLARTTYNNAPDHDLAELLDTDRFPTRADLEEHLLSAYLTTLYDHRRSAGPHSAAQPTWNPDHARHWLGFLATHLTQLNTHNLTWWQLNATLHRRTRIFTTAFIAGLIGGLVNLFTNVPLLGLVIGLVAGFVSGVVIGLASGLVNETKFRANHTGWPPEQFRLRFRRTTATKPPYAPTKRLASELTTWLVVGFMIGLAGGSGVPLVLWVVDGLADTPRIALEQGLLDGFVFGLTVGLSNVVVAAFSDISDRNEAISPWSLLRTDRTVAIARALIVGLVFGLVDRFLVGFVYVFALGLAAGIPYMAIRLLHSAWGNWLVGARLWLPLTRRLPWRPKLFLEDAYKRGVLRQAGAVYQFRHARLRDHLARHYRAKPAIRPHTVGTPEPATTSPTNPH